MARKKELKEFEVEVEKTIRTSISVMATDAEHARQMVDNGEWKHTQEMEIDCRDFEIIGVTESR